MKSKWKYLFLFFVFIGILYAIAYYRSLQFSVIHPTRGDIIEAVYGLGKVKSDQRYEVIAGIISSVTKKFVKEGDYVDKGNPLIQLESGALFRAPFTGTVTYAPLYPGETILPHVPILRLEDLKNRYIELSLEQQSAIRVKIGQPAKVSFESLRGKVLPGKVEALFPREDEFLARIVVSGLDASILPGMTADVSIEIGQIHDAILVPLKSIQNGMVTKKNGHHWQKIKVDIGHIDGFSAEIRNNGISLTDELRIQAGD